MQNGFCMSVAGALSFVYFLLCCREGDETKFNTGGYWKITDSRNKNKKGRRRDGDNGKVCHAIIFVIKKNSIPIFNCEFFLRFNFSSLSDAEWEKMAKGLMRTLKET